MQFLVVMCAFFAVGLSVRPDAGWSRHVKSCDFARGSFINAFGVCIEGCPEGTLRYATGCGYKIPEATCEEPNPKTDYRGMICDFVACYCESPTVRDKVSGKCVPIDECPK